MNPSHKHVGPKGPGQIKNDITISDYIERKQNSFDRYPYMKHSTAEPQETVKKLSFDEWWDLHGDKFPFAYPKASAQLLWDQAQKNV